jgi:hypothetical protein
MVRLLKSRDYCICIHLFKLFIYLFIILTTTLDDIKETRIPIQQCFMDAKNVLISEDKPRKCHTEKTGDGCKPFCEKNLICEQNKFFQNSLGAAHN